MVTKLIIGLQLITLLLAGFLSEIHAQTVTAFVDRNPIHLNETVQFTIKWSGPNPGTVVNLDALRKDFEVLGTSQSNQSSIINGQTKMSTEWISTLAPKRAGKLEIPAIQVGPFQTSPITLTVLASPQPGQEAVSSDIFLETSVEPKDPYIQSQVTYTIRLYHAVPLREGHLGDPSVPEAMVTRLGEDVTFEAVKEGRRYQVVERKFAIIPQKSGTMMIPPIVFDGKVPVKKARRPLLDDLFNKPFRSFGNDPFNAIFQSLKPVRSRSESHQLHVQPVPPSMKHDVWLPAKELTLTEDWVPDPGQSRNGWRVGEAVTRTIVLRAKGLTGPQLPEISLPDQPQLKVYPDQPKIDTQDEGPWSVGIREEKLALVPTSPGSLQLPEIQVPWWDVNQHQRRVAILPARTLTILPESGQSSAPESPTQQPSLPTPLGSGSSITSIKVSPDPALKSLPQSKSFPLLWPSITGVLLLGWLITGVGWLSDRRKATRITKTSNSLPTPHAPSERELLSAFRRACEGNDPKRARSTLLRWTQQKWKSPVPVSLGDVARQAKDAEVRLAIWGLDRSLYAPESPDWDGSKFYQLVVSALNDTKTPTLTEKDVLAPLYQAKT